MPYIVKVTTSCKDAALPDADQVAAIKQFYIHDIAGHDHTAVRETRKAYVGNGDLLARGSTITEDGKQVRTTNIWKNEAAFIRFRADPSVTAYMAALREQWDVLVETP
jgi:hypothetical protein